LLFLGQMFIMDMTDYQKINMNSIGKVLQLRIRKYIHTFVMQMDDIRLIIHLMLELSDLLPYLLLQKLPRTVQLSICLLGKTFNGSM
jgi:hypothetical protein